jgi:hypothetical protein
LNNQPIKPQLQSPDHPGADHRWHVHVSIVLHVTSNRNAAHSTKLYAGICVRNVTAELAFQNRRQQYPAKTTTDGGFCQQSSAPGKRKREINQPKIGNAQRLVTSTPL